MNVEKKGNSRYSGVDIFASKLRCGECGSYYGSKVWHSNSKYRRVIYQCNKKFENEHKCPTPHFYEEEIKELFIKAVNILIANKKEIISNLETVRSVIADTSELEKEKQTARQSVVELADLLQACIDRNARIAQNQDDYNREYNSLSKRYNSAKKKCDLLESKISECKVRSETIEHFIKTLKGQQEILAEFDDNLWGGLLDYITVYSKDDVRFTFKDGTEIKA